MNIKNGFILFVGMLLLLVGTSVSAAEDPEPDSFDSQPYTDDPVYKTTFPEAPGMVFDVPKDTRITNKNNGIQIESPSHYTFRKIEAQDQHISSFRKKLDDFAERLGTAEEKVKELEKGMAQPEKKPAKSSLSSIEERPQKTEALGKP